MSNGDSNQFRRRLPALEKKISEIRADKDVRVRITGIIIGLGDNSVMIDDSTGKVEILFDKGDMLAGLREGQLVKIFTRVLPLIDGFECRGECIQMLDNFDLDLYKKAQEIMIR